MANWQHAFGSLFRGNFGAFFRQVSNDGLSIFLGVVLVFLLINFNRDLGTIFMFMLLLDWFMFKNKPFINFLIEKDDERVTDVIFGVLSYAVFLVLASVFMSVFVGGMAVTNPLNSVFDKLAATVPILADSKILTFIGWGILIPIIETRFFFGSLMESIAHVFNVSLNLKSVKSWIVFGITSGIFAFFHLSAKAVTDVKLDNPAIALTFIFGLMSCILVVYRKELSSAVYLHILNNSVSTAGMLKWINLASILGVSS